MLSLQRSGLNAGITMKYLLIAAASLFVAVPAFSAPYLPMGPQTNVALSTVTNGGWAQCYSSSMSTPFGNNASNALSGCTGGKLMLAGRATGSDTLLVLAQADKQDVLFDTGQNFDVTHEANGTAFYNADSYSLGFAPAGESVFKYQCDTVGGDGRLCLHTFDWVGGYRINDINGLNSSTDYEKLAFTMSVPEPATWTLMIVGFGLVGAMMRRRTRQSFNGTYA